MKTVLSNGVCSACRQQSAGNFCPACGQTMAVKRLSLHELLHEVFHFFTHVEKGFLYTLRMLLVAPGTMQKEYVAGVRVRHQKPFSMFFLSATVSALIYYGINTIIVKGLHAGSVDEADFFRRYWALFHTVMMPVYAFITYLFFRRSGYFFGEIAVLQLYLFSAILLPVSILQVLRLAVPGLETRYIELPLIIAYTILTNIRFFTSLRKGQVVLISILCISTIFLIASVLQDKLMDLLYRH